MKRLVRPRARRRAPSARVASRAWWLALLLAGCGGGLNLSVDVRTDLVPGAELHSVVLEVASADRTRMTQMDVGPDATAFTGMRIADMAGLPAGEHAVRVTLRDADGGTLLERELRLELREDHALTVVLTRSCRGIECGESSTCVGGACTDPGCSPLRPDLCPAECEADADCAAPLAACAAARCVDRVCLAMEVSDACAVDHYCDPEVGCRAYDAMDAPTLLRPLNGWNSGRLDGADLAWTRVAGAAAYQVELGFCEAVDFPVCPEPTVVVTVSMPAFSFRQPSPRVATTEAWRVRACETEACDGATSAWSSRRWYRRGHLRVTPREADDMLVSAAYADTVYVVYGNDLSMEALPASGHRSTGLALELADVDGSARAEALAGAPDDGAGGAVVIWHSGGACTGWCVPPEVMRAPDPHPSMGFGMAIRAVGDVNFDGYPDLAVSEVDLGDGAARPGAVHLYAGPIDARASVPVPFRTLEPVASTGPPSYFGNVLAAGDYDGDGRAELAVGHYAAEQLVVYDLSPAGAERAAHTVELGAPAAALVSGDLNGDGFDDLVVGMPTSGETATNGGAVHLYRGGATGLVFASQVADTSLTENAHFGRAVGLVDAVGDEGLELLVGAPGSETVAGYVRGFGGLSELSPVPVERILGAPSRVGDSFGNCLTVRRSSTGPRVLVGAPNLGSTEDGYVAVYDRREDGTVTTQTIATFATGSADAFGLLCR